MEQDSNVQIPPFIYKIVDVFNETLCNHSAIWKDAYVSLTNNRHKITQSLIIF